MKLTPSARRQGVIIENTEYWWSVPLKIVSTSRMCWYETLQATLLTWSCCFSRVKSWSSNDEWIFMWWKLRTWNNIFPFCKNRKLGIEMKRMSNKEWLFYCRNQIQNNRETTSSGLVWWKNKISWLPSGKNLKIFSWAFFE